MASRGGGSRPVGTDGNDFMHREKVASQYEIRFVLFFKLNIQNFLIILFFLGKIEFDLNIKCWKQKIC